MFMTMVHISAVLAALWAYSLLSSPLSSAQQVIPGYSGLNFPLEQNVGVSDLFPMPPCGAFKLEEATIDDMQAAMENGTLTSVQLITCYLARTFQTQSYIKYTFPDEALILVDTIQYLDRSTDVFFSA